jgi:hypothetical protein
MKKIAATKLLVAACCIIAICSLYPPPSYAVYNGTISDNFDGATINTRLWRPHNENSQHIRMAQQAGELNIQIDGGSLAFAGLRSKFFLKGDFEMTMDYRLINWPTANGVRLGFEGPGSAVPNGSVMVKRVSFSADEPSPDPNNRENYLAAFSADELAWYGGILPTTDDHGSLKLTRVGSVLTGYFKQGDVWQPIGSYSYPAPGPGEWIQITLVANTPGNISTSGPVQIAFSHFQVSYEEVKFIQDLSPLNLLLLD